MSSSLFDNPNFWDPIWRRILVVVIGLIWMYLEWQADSLILVGVGALLSGLAIYEFFLTGHYPKSEGATSRNQDVGR